MNCRLCWIGQVSATGFCKLCGGVEHPDDKPLIARPRSRDDVVAELLLEGVSWRNITRQTGAANGIIRRVRAERAIPRRKQGAPRKNP